MSAPLAKPAKLKSDIRLAQAISEFQKDLPTELKARFSAYQAQSQKCPPDTSDVMRLTAEIDRHGVGRGRCLGPRFTNFLQAVQQFAALGDIIVGGSQNAIACGVWSLVRLSLLMIVTSSSYIEKLSALLMMVGRSAPRYQSMALIYPRSKELQDHLFEYFTVVVHLCRDILKFSQKSKFGQMASSLSDAVAKNYESQLELWANNIKEDVNGLMAKSIEEERLKNSHFRALSSMSSISASLRQKIKATQRLLESCSTFDYQTIWKQTRKVGNSTLFNQNPEYQAWKRSTSSCTLIYTGKLGSGKSVLMANIVDDLHLHVETNKSPVSYFFCRHDLPESLKARTVIGSLVRQVLDMLPGLTNSARYLEDTSAALDINQISDLLQRTLSPDMTAYAVVDGLDECSGPEKESVLRQLRILQEKFRFLICVSFRLEAETTVDLKSGDYHAVRTITIPEANPDIDAFIKAELARCIKAEKLTLRDPALIIEIHDALVRDSQGMFLWVALQIETLCAMKTDHDIRQALADLPKDLSETYSRILRKLKEPRRNYQQLILELVLVARRPLTTEELREALSVTPGDNILNPAKLINDIYSTLACCGSLIVVDEEESTVRLVHHSVKQYLYGAKGSIDMEFTVDHTNKTMADIIITYLSYGIFGTQLSSAVAPQIMAGSVPSRIIRSTADPSCGVQNLALKLLESRKLRDFDIGRTLADTSNIYTCRTVIASHFHIYAKLYWLEHTLCTSEQTPTMRRLLPNLLRENVTGSKTLIGHIRPLLLWASRNGHEGVIKVLFDSCKPEADVKDPFGRTPLSWAAGNGHEAVVKILLDSGKVKVNRRDKDGRTPLSWAAGNGHEGVVKILLNSRKAEFNSKDKYGQSPLSWATGNGHEAVIKILLDAGWVEAKLRDLVF